MRLVVDANILVAELMRERGRKLIARPELKLYMAEKACFNLCDLYSYPPWQNALDFN